MTKDDRRARLAAGLDWEAVAPLRLRAKALADGLYAGSHRSRRRGAGVEFGGHRPYVPGDDLRFLDLRAMMRHDRLVVRELETDTDRSVWLVVDASASMGAKSRGAPSTKLERAGLLAAALARLAVAAGDPVGLSFVAGERAHPMPPRAGREAFERIADALEAVRPAGDASADPAALDRAFGVFARRARRGAIVILLSDLLDLPDDAIDRFAALASGGRTLVAAQVLDPIEAGFGFEGRVRLASFEGPLVVETDADEVRARYLAALDELGAKLSKRLASVGGRLVRATTDAPAIESLRAIVGAAAGQTAGAS